MTNSTVASNQAIGGQGGSSGAGVKGGKGGSAFGLSDGLASGLGGNGGKGGNGGTTGAPSRVDGGGIHFDPSNNPRVITSSTVAYNSVKRGFDAGTIGGAGAGGLAGTSGIGRTTTGSNGVAGTAGTLGVAQPALGGGIFQDDAVFGTGLFNLTLRNSIVGANTANNSAASDIIGTLTNPGASLSNLIGIGGSGGLVAGTAGNLVGISNLGLVPLGSYGGETQTVAITTTSPAYNAGDNATVQAAGLTTDQRGFTRINDAKVDIGAFEGRESLVVTTLVDENNGTTDPTVGTGTSLREAIALANTKSGLQTITFAIGLTGKIDLNSPHPTFTANTSLQGPGAGLLTVRRNSTVLHQLFDASASSNVKISGLTISNGGDSAIWNNGIMEVTNSMFAGNTTPTHGGAIRNSGNLAVHSSTFTGGQGKEGGAICSDGVLYVDNSTFSANLGVRGGAVFIENMATINNSTLANNRAFNNGAEIYLALSNVTMNNTIVVTSGRTEAALISQSRIQGSHNMIPFISGAADLRDPIVRDPKLGPLQDNGGPTPTMALLPGSVAINAGDNSVVPANLTTDQRGSGFARIRGGTVDLGAFEVAGDPPTVSANQASVTATEGSAATNTGSFGDPQGRATVTLSASLGTVTKNDSIGTWQWSYIPPDDLSTPVEVVITATDNFGMKTHTTFSASVANVAPTIAISGARSVAGGTTYTLNLGAVSDPGADTVSQYIVHWGDGTSDTYTSPGDKSHVYADGDALRFITVDLVDEDGSYTNTASLSVTASNYGVGQQPISLAKGDFNGDGRPDLVTADGQSNTVSVLLNNGAGGFVPAVPYSVGLAPTAVTVGDFNGDGYVDLAVAHYLSGNESYYSDSVSVLMNQGNGTFAAAVEYPAGYSAIAIAAGDLNGDGRADLVTVNDALGDVTVLLSNISGGFDAPAVYASGLMPRSVTVGDFNQDGKADFAVANAGSGNVSILLNAGNGNFSPAVNVPVGVAPSRVAAGEFNGDANPDLVVSDNSAGNVWVMLGNGAGNFSSPVAYATDGGSLAIGDFNKDGKQDLAVGDSAVNILLNSDTGSFAPVSRLSVLNNSVHSMVAADFDGDGLQEFAVVSNAADALSILPGPALQVTRFTPTGLSVSSPTQDMTPTVTWTSVATAVSYDVYLKNQNTSQVIRQTVTGASWTPLADLGIGRFRFWVRSVNAAGAKSAWSLPTTFTVNTAVTVPAQTLGRTVRPNVTWMPLVGAVSYEVWLNDSSRKIAPLMRQSGVTSMSWTPSSDLALGTYTFWVRGVDAAGRVAAWSVPFAFNVQAAPTPTSLISSTFSRQPEFKWTAPVGSASFVLSLANPTTGATQTISGITGTSWTPPSNLADGRWVWRVRAVSQFGSLTYWSDSSRMNVGGQTVVSTPSANRAASAVFNWTAVSGAASYSLWLNRTDIAQVVIRKDGITTNSFTTSSPLAAGTYRIWVRAVSTTGEVSLWSRAVDFTVSSSGNADGPSPNDEHLLVKWELSALPTSIEQMAKDESSTKNEPATDAYPSGEHTNDGETYMDIAIADSDAIWHPVAPFEPSSDSTDSLTSLLTCDVFEYFDEAAMHEFLHGL